MPRWLCTVAHRAVVHVTVVPEPVHFTVVHATVIHVTVAHVALVLVTVGSSRFDAGNVNEKPQINVLMG